MNTKLIDREHIFTPVAVEHIRDRFANGGFRTYRLVYLFGIRVAFWATTKFKD
ncbi:hypothetical protein D3C75_1015790 [compost metagenome]